MKNAYCYVKQPKLLLQLLSNGIAMLLKQTLCVTMEIEVNLQLIL